VIGQPRGVQSITRGFTRLYSGLKRPNGPIGFFVFVGPTGWGKTYMAEELSRFLIADRPQAPLTRIPCSEYEERHAVASLIGSPPGYVGFEKPAVLEQLKIDEAHFWVKVNKNRDLVERLAKARGKKREEYDGLVAELHEQFSRDEGLFSVILFDEVEKAHATLWNLLLHIVGDGELAMRSGSTTLFHNSVIVLTSNVGGKAQQELLKGKTHKVGFGASQERQSLLDDPDAMDREIYQTTIKYLTDKFPPEMMGRFKEGVVVFRALSREQCRPALYKMLRDVDDLLVGRDGKPVRVHYAPEMIEYLLDEGVSAEYGLRNMRDKIEKIVIDRLATALESDDVREGDEVLFRVETDIIAGKKRPKMYVRPQPIALSSTSE
jgi:ATP-dependent Clp protease ATP-binding subunit ClpA